LGDRPLADHAEMLLKRDAPGDAARAAKLAPESLEVIDELGMKSEAMRAATLRKRAEAALSAASRSR
jgi:hypothetical protein